MFKMDGRFLAYLNRIVDLLVLNLIYILCCMPILTIGAARSALLAVLEQMRRDKDHHIVRTYFHRFRRDLGKSTGMWILCLAFGLWMVLDIYAMIVLDLGTARFILMVVFFLGLLADSLTFLCAMGLNCFFENTVKKNLTNGLILALGSFPVMFFMLLLEILPLILAYAIPTILGGVVIFYTMWGFALTVRAELGLYRRIFARFLPEEADEEPEDEEEETSDEELAMLAEAEAWEREMNRE